MVRATHINNLRQHLDYAKERLSLEKLEILKLHPLPEEFSREEYAFFYVRSERIGLRAINRRLSEISWLPMQLDPSSEIMSDDRTSMKRWLTSAMLHVPNSHDFGNDFVHALARCAMNFGVEGEAYNKLSMRVANLFRDLSCMIGLIYYCTWLSEHGIEEVAVSDPGNLNQTVEQIAHMIQSPDFYERLRAKEQGNKAREKTMLKASAEKKRERPHLRIVSDNVNIDPFMPDPAMI